MKDLSSIQNMLEVSQSVSHIKYNLPELFGMTHFTFNANSHAGVLVISCQPPMHLLASNTKRYNP